MNSASYHYISHQGPMKGRNTQEATLPKGHSMRRDRDSRVTRVTLPTRVLACARPPRFPLRCWSLGVSAGNLVWLRFALLCFVDTVCFKN